jgi:pyruvate,orthophosphate dikinase
MTGSLKWIRGHRTMRPKVPASYTPSSVSTGVRRRICFFNEETGATIDDLGAKGFGLAEMSKAGLPVPPGFTITTQVWREYCRRQHLSAGLWGDILAALARLETQTEKQFGRPPAPLLLSVRSGAKVSMPGIMETVLNVGLNAQSVDVIGDLAHNRRFALDSYRRLIQMFGRTVKKIDARTFERILDSYKDSQGVERDSDLSPKALGRIVADFHKVYRDQSGEPFPEDPYVQLRLVIEAVFASWCSAHATTYRRLQRISPDVGTAITIQSMVFGNMGPDSGTGVAFTRDPATGDKGLYGEYLLNAQGEDVVRGTRGPQPISSLSDALPRIYEQLQTLANRLEQHYRDMQNLEFTIEQGRLWLLQLRPGHRTVQAALRIAVELVREGMISRAEALARIAPRLLGRSAMPAFDPAAKALAKERGRYLATGLKASPGAVSGRAILSTAGAWERARGGPAVLVQSDVTLADVLGNSELIGGILTQRGGVTSHAMVIARVRGLTCITGCESLRIDVKNGEFTIGDRDLKEGAVLSLDGSTGEVFLGEIASTDVDLADNEDLRTLLDWADAFARIEIWGNADYPWEVERARRLGAKGIGICGTERMFLGADRLPIVSQMVLAMINGSDYQGALSALEAMQCEDFRELFGATRGLPTAIRLLDTALQHLLPDCPELEETNQSMGLRGARLSILFPEISRMQIRAIFRAASELQRREGGVIPVRILVPLVSHGEEFRYVRHILMEAAQAVMAETDAEVVCKIGAAIETPRAALTAGRLAKHADFFSLDVDALTEATLCWSRQDAELTFIGEYLNKHILHCDPFANVDKGGAGRLMRLAVDEGRETRPDLEIGIIGPQDGMPESMEFYRELDPAYLSCPRSAIPVARLAAAQVELRAQCPANTG